ncbi:hypothetical protein D8674_022550 [Pyrus ussuriensis x Pyrus communis]|uniref:Uncharacterized protein n=1 Tax=Pyrus ussuriensis x Pyrus communis TaxID=2448454 RepID=A0A5N5GQM2_9ROSA|nr:hypothetical protein D8674_022550 [Pyrus ussuriensis x Pyrus communis]
MVGMMVTEIVLVVMAMMKVMMVGGGGGRSFFLIQVRNEERQAHCQKMIQIWVRWWRLMAVARR